MRIYVTYVGQGKNKQKHTIKKETYDTALIREILDFGFGIHER